MKKVLLLAVALMLVASVAFGQAGAIVLSDLTDGSTCNVNNPALGLLTVYAVHTLTGGATASQWAVANNTGGALLYLADSVKPYVLTLGATNTGVSISYQACVPGPNLLIGTLYQVLFNPGPCASLDVIPDPLSLTGMIEGVDCVATQNFPTGGRLTFNGGTACPCAIVPVQETTWGQIKSLYN